MHQRILQAIATADAQHPARQDEVAKRLKVPESEVATAVEQLYAHHEINMAKITRKTESFVAIWPTGVSPAAGSRSDFTINPKKRPPSGVLTRPPRPERGNTVSTNIPPAKPKAPAIDLEVSLKIILKGTSAEAPMTAGEISALLERQQAYWNPAMVRLLDAEVVATTDNPKRKGTRAYYLASPTSPSGAARSPADQAQVSGNNSASGRDGGHTPPAVTASENIPSPIATAMGDGVDASSKARTDMRFAMFDDGELHVFDGDELIIFTPGDTKRLRSFLGCFEPEEA